MLKKGQFWCVLKSSTFPLMESFGDNTEPVLQLDGNSWVVSRKFSVFGLKGGKKRNALSYGLLWCDFRFSWKKGRLIKVSSSHFLLLGVSVTLPKNILKGLGCLRLKRSVFGPLRFPSLAMVLSSVRGPYIWDVQCVGWKNEQVPPQILPVLGPGVLGV